MSRRVTLLLFISLAGLLLSACAAANAPAAEPVSDPPGSNNAGGQPAAPAEAQALDPTAAPDLEGFQPTASPLFEQSYRANPISDRDYSQFEIVTLLPPDGIPALSFPAFYKAERADREYLPEEMVIGVEFNGDARAYPVELLSRHEIVNDTVGGIHLAVTW